VAIVVAEWIVRLLGIYCIAGLLFAPFFAFKGVQRVDPAAAGGTLGFRLIILPGVVALWPLLALRWLRGGRPPAERNAHRDAALQVRR